MPVAFTPFIREYHRVYKKHKIQPRGVTAPLEVMSLIPSNLDDFEREISASPKEFAHGLRTAFGERVQGGPLHFEVQGDDAGMTIDLTPGPDRVIALIRLPTLRARIRFISGEQAARQTMLRHMDRVMQRGGG